MKIKPYSLLSIIYSVPLVACVAYAAFAQTGGYGQEQDKSKPTVSEAEGKAAKAVESAPDLAAKLTAAGEFLKKYPKSTVRKQIADYLVGQIGAVQDATQRIPHAENFQKLFTADTERDAIQPVIIQAYIQAKKTDEAFTQAAALLAKQPENVTLLTQMTIAGTEEAKRQNPKYVTQSQQYGLKAVELIEANKKPADVDDTAWASHKQMLPRLYQNLGILSLVGGKSSEAKTKLEKSVSLDPSDPFNYVLLGSIVNEEYQQLAQSYKSMPEGKPQEEALKKATEMLDKVIDLYARALGTAHGKPEYEQLQAQILQDITPYYKYRHNGSTEGMQQLIDKYKTPAKP